MVLPFSPKSRLFFIVACLGLFSGLAEGAVYWILSIIRIGGWKNDLLPEILWIAPLFNLMVFLVVALLAVALFMVFSKKFQNELFAWAIFGWCAIYGPLSASGKLNQIACVLLASGVAVQLCRFVRARPVSNLFLTWTLVALSVTVVLVSVFGEFEARIKIHSGSIAKARPNSPNVLLITLDTLRADHLSSYGYPRKTTPNIDRLAEEGVLFENAFAGASWTLPSHATIMTGQPVHVHRAGGQPLDSRFPTLAEYFSARGYATAAFIANEFYCSSRTGLDRGFALYDDYYANIIDMAWRTFYGRLVLSELPLLGYYNIPGRRLAADVNAKFFDWLDEERKEPFFVFLNYFDVHDPYIAPVDSPRAFSTYSTRGRLINSLLFPRDFTGGRVLSAEERQAAIAGYDGSLAYLDAQLGFLFERLKAMGLLDNTLVIITSDHGESFGNHGLYGHGNSLYTNLLHVPLIFRYPKKVPARTRVTEAVSLQSIPATVLGILASTDSPFPGDNLAPYWVEKRLPDATRVDFAVADSLPGIVQNPAYPLGRRSAMKSISTSQWHLILYEEGKVELFRTDHDPSESTNLAVTSEGREIISDLGSRVAKKMTRNEWSTFGASLRRYHIAIAAR
jgi:arylsulfatase A-like enzyme